MAEIFLTNESIDSSLKYNEETGLLGVNMADEIAEDNTLPVSSALVNTTVGNIEVLLSTI